MPVAAPKIAVWSRKMPVSTPKVGALWPKMPTSSSKNRYVVPKMTFRTRTDPTRNVDRFYVVDITPTLFGEWALVREWGRRGSAGTMRLSSYARRDDAQIAERGTIKRRLQRGYTARHACLSTD